jgi:hypothetical protein
VANFKSHVHRQEYSDKKKETLAEVTQSDETVELITRNTTIHPASPPPLFYSS